MKIHIKYDDYEVFGPGLQFGGHPHMALITISVS